jgi:hypothetical protein
MEGITMFKDFVFKKYQQYQDELWKERGVKATISMFADHVGENQGDISHWINGTRTPKGRILDRLAKKWGPEVYTAAGAVEPAPTDPLLRKVLRLMANLPPDVQEEIAQLAEEKAREARENKASHSSGGSGKNFSMQTP